MRYWPNLLSWLQRAGHKNRSIKIRHVRNENAPEFELRGDSKERRFRAMGKLGNAKAQGTVTIPGILLLAIVTVILIAAVIVVKLLF